MPDFITKKNCKRLIFTFFYAKCWAEDSKNIFYSSKNRFEAQKRTAARYGPPFQCQVHDKAPGRASLTPRIRWGGVTNIARGGAEEDMALAVARSLRSHCPFLRFVSSEDGVAAASGFDIARAGLTRRPLIEKACPPDADDTRPGLHKARPEHARWQPLLLGSYAAVLKRDNKESDVIHAISWISALVSATRGTCADRSHLIIQVRPWCRCSTVRGARVCQGSSLTRFRFSTKVRKLYQIRKRAGAAWRKIAPPSTKKKIFFF